MTVIAVADLIVEPQIQYVAEIARRRDWPFERVSPRRFRISLRAKDGQIFQLEVDCDEFPVMPPAFHWRNPDTGELDQPSDSPRRLLSKWCGSWRWGGVGVAGWPVGPVGLGRAARRGRFRG